MAIFNFPLPPSSRPLPSLAEARLHSWAKTVSALKELRQEAIKARNDANLNSILDTIWKLENRRESATDPVADAVFDAATIVEEGKTVRFVGDFSHVGVGSQSRELGEGHESGWERLEIVNTGLAGKGGESGEKAAEGKAAEGKTAEEKADEEKAAEEKAAEEKPLVLKLPEAEGTGGQGKVGGGKRRRRRGGKKWKGKGKG